MMITEKPRININKNDVWNKLAEKRDMKGAKFVSHKKAWSVGPAKNF